METQKETQEKENHIYKANLLKICRCTLYWEEVRVAQAILLAEKADISEGL